MTLGVPAWGVRFGPNVGEIGTKCGAFEVHVNVLKNIFKRLIFVTFGANMAHF